MQTVYNMVILYACLNTGVGVLAEAFGVDIGIPVIDALDDLTTQQNTISQIVNDDGGFDAALIFGDWLTVGRMFVNMITGGYMIGMLHLMAQAGINFPPIFTAGMGALSAIAFVWGIMYLVSGRGTKQSD
jgi:hypothetical protein